MSKHIAIDWYAGPGSQIELFSPPAHGGMGYQLRYAPPFRHAIRPPVEVLQLGAGELGRIDHSLESLLSLVKGARGQAGAPLPTSEQLLEQLREATGQLFFLIIPDAVGADLRGGPLFVEVGVDEGLVKYPWELMHDGEEFLCLKHYVGRYVNSRTSGTPPQHGLEALGPGRTVEKLRILVIGVASPQPRPDGTKFSRLTGVDTEVQAVFDSLANVDWIQLELLQNAKYNDVYEALRQHAYHIIHFSGHAFYDAAKPYQSGLVLHDANMTTGPLSRLVKRSPPLLCFVNACESGLAPTWGESYDIFGLAQTLLTTGTYLLGSRWQLADFEAAGFAKTFYEHLLKKLEPIGQALVAARKATKDASQANNLAWASYVFYGDPRIGFRPVTN